MSQSAATEELALTGSVKRTDLGGCLLKHRSRSVPFGRSFLHFQKTGTETEANATILPIIMYNITERISVTFSRVRRKRIRL